jgi:hypothetical protein
LTEQLIVVAVVLLKLHAFALMPDFWLVSVLPSSVSLLVSSSQHPSPVFSPNTKISILWCLVKSTRLLLQIDLRTLLKLSLQAPSRRKRWGG